MPRLPKPARFLLRIDDLCPTVHADRWQRLRLLVEKYSIQPILAVVPDNHDRALQLSPPDAAFWQQMRDLQAAGATIGLHGYSHVPHRAGPALVPIHRTGEFAGVPLPQQRQWIAAGCGVLRGHGLQPRLWIAPRHAFDRNTVRAVREQGIQYLSDGLARRPFERGGITWIPMQLWGPVAKQRGLWTICIHPNTLDKLQLERLRIFLAESGAQFTSFDRLVSDYVPTRLGPIEKAYEMAMIFRLRLRRSLRLCRD